ncbi:hypothetical protein G5I_13654 [Acromyrmex echinatior]|uniref:Uncharacterized protein n=1 Tax=Acromyrmex echinatior TaxID=103372 RepID=F4X5L8_ACREC|nr:hypothetical protein G5I_13654 [Acromyrmex echinatior]
MSDSTDLPNQDTLLDFITRRTLTFKAAKSKSLKVSDNPSRSAKSHQVKKYTESSQCVLCKGQLTVGSAPRQQGYFARNCAFPSLFVTAIGIPHACSSTIEER